MNVNLNEAMTSLCELKFEMFIVLNTKYQIAYATTIFPRNKWFWCETIFFSQYNFSKCKHIQSGCWSSVTKSNSIKIYIYVYLCTCKPLYVNKLQFLKKLHII